MSWFDGIGHRLRTLFRPAAYARELDEEIRLHLELDAMQQRDSDAARRRFGNRTYYTEEARQMTWLAIIDILRQDLGHAWRSMLRSPGFTLLIVITLALGIGVNTATFSVLDELYLRPPAGVTEPASVRRVWVEHHLSRDGVPFLSQHLNYPIFRAIVEGAGDQATASVFTTPGRLRLGFARPASRVWTVFASASYFDVLGARPAMGRVFAVDEDRMGEGAPVAVVSHAFWRNRLGGDSTAIGQKIVLDRVEYHLIGVLRPSFTGLDHQPADVWIPLAAMPAPSWMREGRWWDSGNMYNLRAVLRAEPGAPPGEIESRATQLVQALNRRTRPGPDTLMAIHTGSIIEARGPGEARQEHVIGTRLAGVAGIVLLIACANVTNMLLARAVRRRREIAVRLALGISRWRLARLLTTETLLLAAFAGAAALLAGWWGGTVLRSLLMPGIEAVGGAPHARVVLFTMAVALLAGLAAGIVPAMQASDPRLTTALKDGGREGVQHRSRLRRGLVVTQAALSVVLLFGAGLFVRSLQNVQGLDIGFDADRILFGSVIFEDGERPPTAQLAATMREIAARIEGRPGIEAVARTDIPPMRGFSFITFYSGADSAGSFGPRAPLMHVVSPGFFRATGLRVLRGRGFTGGDVDGAPAEVVVNEATAALLWPGREPIGQCLRFSARDNPCHTVVGVVANARRDAVIETESFAQMYVPLGNAPRPVAGGTIVVRTSPALAGRATTELESALRLAFPSGEARVTPMMQYLESDYRPWRLGATLFTAFGGLALVVALIGIYSTVSYGVSQRTHEFGVRIALGARIGDVLRQVIGEGLRTVAIGVALGIMLALAAVRLISALLYGVSPSDPRVLLLVAATLLVVAALAALVPAWRAARVDPVVTLRSD